jgi:hypothetical protein
MKTYIIGPSHIDNCFLEQIQTEIDNETLFKDCILDSYVGIPNWSRNIETQILEKMNNHNIVWLVSDYKFNNHEYEKVIELEKINELFLETLGFHNNVRPEMQRHFHMETLGKHSLRVIDHIIKICPNIKLIFWCLYTRSRVNRSSYPQYLWYNSIKEKYKNNIIDIDAFINPKDFEMGIQDSGGHPNKKGYELMSRMIESAFPSR